MPIALIVPEQGFRFTLASLRRGREPAPHFGSGNYARPLRDNDSPTQQDDIGNRLRPLLPAERRKLPRFDLEDQAAPGHFPRQFMYFRRRHPARTAPGRPKIYPDRHFGLTGNL